MQTITERYLEFYDYLKSKKIIKTATEFIHNAKIGSSMITEMYKGRSKLGIDTLQNTVSAYPILNSNWVLTGEGDMLNEKAPAHFAKGAKRKKKEDFSSGNLVTVLSLMRVRLREAEDSLSDLKQSFGNVLDLLKSLGIDSSVVEEIQDAHL